MKRLEKYRIIRGRRLYLWNKTGRLSSKRYRRLDTQ